MDPVPYSQALVQFNCQHFFWKPGFEISFQTNARPLHKWSKSELLKILDLSD